MTASLLQDIIPEDRVHLQAALSDYTTMRVGGPADYIVEPVSEEEIISVIKRVREASLPLFVMGNGSNLIFSDAGFRGVILHIGSSFAGIQWEDQRINAQAGALLSTVSHKAAELSLSGLEFAAGIPGSVGGAVCMNAGAYGGEMAQVLESATVLIDDHIETWDSEQLQFGYRHSAVMDTGCLVLSARFRLQSGNRDEILDNIRNLNAKRREKQPLQFPSSGSFFKRPAGYYAGALIEQAGLKGASVGDAQVSEKHAGFIINRGKATAEQIYALMKRVQNAVYQQSGVMLEPEVKLIGNFDP